MIALGAPQLPCRKVYYFYHIRNPGDPLILGIQTANIVRICH